MLTIQDKSIVTNKTTTVAKNADPTFNTNRQGTYKLTGISTSTVYSGSVAGSNWTVTTDSDDTYSDALTKIKTAIDALNVSGLTTTKLKDSLRLTRNASFTLTGTGGPYANQLTVFQDQVATLDELPSESVHNHIVKIINSGALTKAYYLKYIATNSTSGPGYWTETIAPDTSTGLNNATMPLSLIHI